MLSTNNEDNPNKKCVFQEVCLKFFLAITNIGLTVQSAGVGRGQSSIMLGSRDTAPPFSPN